MRFEKDSFLAGVAVGNSLRGWSGGGGGASTPCLAGHTRITMGDGSLRRLDSLSPGDEVLGGDGQPTRVTLAVRGRWNVRHVLYTFEDGTVIDESDKHRFYNVEQGFWQYLKDWKIGEHAVALGADGGAAVDGGRADTVSGPCDEIPESVMARHLTALVKVERIDEPAECFGLWTESGDYFAEGLLTGETAANQRLLKDATPEKAARMLASVPPEVLADFMRREGYVHEEAFDLD